MIALDGKSAIQALGLTKDFGNVRALDDVEFEVREGEVFGYLGPNGAGKTTTIRLMLGLINPSRGSVSVLGGSGADPKTRGRIGYLPGELRLDPRYTSRDLVRFYGALRGGVDEDLVEALHQRFDLDPTRPIGELSSGNRRKVGIVQTFMHRPELLLLDEPSGGLDPLLQHEFQLLVKEAVANGATVFLSSHQLPEVEMLAHRVGILRQGRLVTVAGIDDLRRQARQRIDLHVGEGATVSVFAALPEVVSASAADGVIRLVVEGSVDQVIKAASRMEVRRIVSHEVDLEEVFLSYYREGEG